MGMFIGAFFADELGIKKVYVFPSSATFSAFGILCSDIIRTASFSLGYSMPIDHNMLDSEIKKREHTLMQDMEEEGFSRGEIVFRHIFNMRYKRQVNYHSVDLPRNFSSRN